jgi:ATP phosphoribosyltransferase
MKTNRPVTVRQEQQHERALCTAILALRSVEECRSFFRDLCTPAELQAMADRWAVVELLERGLPYREIHKQTGVSVTTIGRVARYLTSGNGGYRAVTERLKLNARTAPPEPMRLKIAMQKSGRLTDSSLDLLSRCGLKYSRGKDQLMCYGENMPLDVLFVRDDDIPDLVQEDVCDLGWSGLNVVEEKRLAFAARGIAPLFETVQLLDFGRCKLCIAVPDGFDYRGANRCRASASRRPIRTSCRAFLARARHRAEVVVLSGAVEIAPRLGRADVICDLVSTGSTLAANHLRQAETCSRARRC